MSKALTNDVEITLGGEIHALRPSLKAASAISRQFGGFMGAMQAIANGDLSAFQFIARQGTTAKNISTDDLNEAVWSAGTTKLTRPFLRYLGLLQNGGRDPDEENEAEEVGEQGNGEI